MTAFADEAGHGGRRYAQENRHGSGQSAGQPMALQEAGVKGPWGNLDHLHRWDVGDHDLDIHEQAERALAISEMAIDDFIGSLASRFGKCKGDYISDGGNRNAGYRSSRRSLKL